jgi:restriction system protein
MIPSSACLSRQSDRAANAARKHRSYTTLWGTITWNISSELSTLSTVRRRAKHISTDFAGHDFALLIAEILKAQGYTVNVSLPGADKGIDIVAGIGTLGFDQPRLVVQVKSGNIVADQQTLQALLGAVHDVQGSQGLLVCWGGFTKPVEQRRNELFFRIRLWGRQQVLDALFEVYDKLPEWLRAELPLRRVWMLEPDVEE